MSAESKGFEESAGSIVFREDPGLGSCVLFLKTYDKYDLPKGHLEIGESPIDAAVRETFEECAFNITTSATAVLDDNFPVARLLRGVIESDPIICDNINKKNGTIRKRVYLYPVETRYPEPVITRNEKGIFEHQGWVWCPIDDVERYKLHDYLKSGVRKAIQIYETHRSVNEALKMIHA
jgi:8-oxo-dGTP pyrophosphatase MutT (NUDIX family)